MNMVTVTSQGQITIPAKIRKAWGINKSTKLKVSFDENSRRMTVEKPIGLDELRQMARKLTKKSYGYHEFQISVTASLS